jgi:hypothetical protein
MLFAVSGMTIADSPSTDTADLSKGFQMLDTLRDLKAVSDQRLADCNTAIGDLIFCKCVNDRLTLELSFVDYVAMVTAHKDEITNTTLLADKIKYLDEARHVREVCAVKNRAAPNNR